MLLYRDEYYNPDTPDKGVLEVNLSKQRNGPTGLVKMQFNKDFQQIA
ncbi:DnaB-like helicase C-terminal domain-containing protein [Paenibacillus alvei]